MKTITLLSILFYIFFSHHLHCQIVINEISNVNSTFLDEDGDAEDWIELYNAGAGSVNINNYSLSDNVSYLNKWIFPNVSIAANSHLLLMASGKNRTTIPAAIDHWETAVHDTTMWKYFIGVSSGPTSGWATLGYNDSSWSSGMGGIGYDDGDDSTVIPNTFSVYLRKQFNIADPSVIAQAILHIDYDDGFVAYLNGVEIARSGSMGGVVGVMPAYNDLAAGHEALMYLGMLPEAYTISEPTLTSILIPGANVLCVQVHNQSFSSSDLTARAFLSFAITDNSYNYYSLPSWFIPTPAATSYLHTNFKIAKQGEMIYLSDSSTTIVSSLNPGGNLDLNNSFGLSPDGAVLTGIFAVPTPGYTNNGQTLYSSYATAPAFSIPAGFYPSAISVSITVPPEQLFVILLMEAILQQVLPSI